MLKLREAPCEFWLAISLCELVMLFIYLQSREKLKYKR